MGSSKKCVCIDNNSEKEFRIEDDFTKYELCKEIVW